MFLDEVVSDVPDRQEIHFILDNYCTHKKSDDWLAKHPNVHFHFTPTSASWLNQVEIWFSIFTPKSLHEASFKSTQELTQAIEQFVTHYNKNAAPFVWRKREIKAPNSEILLLNLSN